MAKKAAQDRSDLLADVAEMYYLEGLNQAAIAKRVGVTRSMVSRMITEARQMGIVHIWVEREFSYDEDLQARMITTFGLVDATIYKGRSENHNSYLKRLGRVAADVMKSHLKPGIILGTAWGSALEATVNALYMDHPVDAKIVQLVGALGGRNLNYDSHGLVTSLVEKLGGEGYYLNVPYIADKPETVQSLIHTQGVRETMEMMPACDLCLVGIGSTELDYSTFYNAGYLIFEEMQGLAEVGAVGNVCGLFFDKDGQPTAREFQSRSFTISHRDLKKIPLRIGIAGGSGKITAMLGALRGGYINHIITDNYTASEVLRLHETGF